MDKQPWEMPSSMNRMNKQNTPVRKMLDAVERVVVVVVVGVGVGVAIFGAVVSGIFVLVIRLVL